MLESTWFEVSMEARWPDPSILNGKTGTHTLVEVDFREC